MTEALYAPVDVPAECTNGENKCETGFRNIQGLQGAGFTIAEILVGLLK